jgi:hypothetical protein
MKMLFPSTSTCDDLKSPSGSCGGWEFVIGCAPEDVMNELDRSALIEAAPKP